MEVLKSALAFQQRTAIVAAGQSYRYRDVLSASLAACRKLEGAAAAPAAAPASGGASGNGPRVALFADPGAEYVAGQFGTWLHSGISVPLCLSHPDRELQYVLEDAEVSSVLASEQHAERLYRLAQPFGAAVHVVEAQPSAAEQQQQQEDGQEADELEAAVSQRLVGQRPQDGALIIYTSGTTGRPKGALHTHSSLLAMVDNLCSAWQWQADDRILHTLPLHHVHGIVNALLCTLRAGACVDMLPRFQPGEVWQHLLRLQDPVTVFMGVPTMYSKLLSMYDHMEPSQQQQAAAAARRLRLTVSGSAACPTPIMERWEQLSGEKLLERYGMTETGMLLGNPYRGERRPGTVGQPFPGVQVCITNADGSDAGPGPGELRVCGPQLFKEYWRRPDATADAFDEQGFFLTGDTGVLEDGGYYRLLGRTSVDVIKQGGYKISALHIESALLEHPAIAEVAVLGLPDAEYGETIAAVVALKTAPQATSTAASSPAASGANGGSSSSGSSSAASSSSSSSSSGSSSAASSSGNTNTNGNGSLSLHDLRAWARDRLPPYQLPRHLELVEAIPRNAMGKVNKKELRRQLFPEA
ncbi:malonate-- ligase [Chlorella sorokiniana]|uniref:Malonate--ligase n=1 Tax=Chlorella sorokiniana TaxID=3076 RepID=A0A2P6TQ44_CHLSO|nr:malonate-- ligase [Chlorella sorokiniana]|eukprot:PRW56153.1 malonate-- ligase [Chlorella sorokiniana]